MPSTAQVHESVRQTVGCLKKSPTGTDRHYRWVPSGGLRQDEGNCGEGGGGMGRGERRRKWLELMLCLKTNKEMTAAG